ncbi:DoxX family protein [Allostreptomyces psammosilenae]|uniref:ABC-type multidrug transport system permease subunit n=1 Tax=Allostreptomyces psammosilenae TaxID=1892865 RepID=A0A852ZSC2_9ACTN|nr:DoxX family protein [Allostreptomyces psammosilenae]NYI05336.1 ABC-type multidrug transport system permease subunit [Allostreptomyces psammosilenae]
MPVFTAYVVVSALLALLLAASSVFDFTRREDFLRDMAAMGVPESWLPGLGALKLAGAVGLLVGTWVPLLGIAAAIGLVLYFVGAVITHVRSRRPSVVPPVAFGLLAVAALVLRLAAV